MRQTGKRFLPSIVLFAVFTVFTVMLLFIDVQPIGSNGETLGMATVNRAVFTFFGEERPFFRTLTNVIGGISLTVMAGFAILGLVQWCRRRSLSCVDRDLFALGGVYALMLFFYFLFEVLVVNARPDASEASYPSSHTLLVLCVMATALSEIRARLKKGWLRCTLASLCWLLLVITPIGRLLSGAHWLTDVIGAILLSAALISLFTAVSGLPNARKSNKAIYSR